MLLAVSCRGRVGSGGCWRGERCCAWLVLGWQVAGPTVSAIGVRRSVRWFGLGLASDGVAFAKAGLACWRALSRAGQGWGWPGLSH